MPVALLAAVPAPLGTPDPLNDRPLAMAGWTGSDSWMERHQSRWQADLGVTALISVEDRPPQKP